MKKFFVVAKKYGQSSPFKLTLEAKDSGDALSSMFFYLNIPNAGLLEEYELYEVLEGNRYLSVARKYYSPSKVPEKVVLKQQESVYTSYREAA